MNLPDTYIQGLVDGLAHSHLSFALYRLPWTDECRFVLQASGEVERPENIESLNGKKDL